MSDEIKKRILVVEDDEKESGEIKKILEGEGYEVDIANDGAEAVDLVEKDGYELITLDIKMPTLSGHELLSVLKERLNGKTKVIYLTIVPKEEISNVADVDGYVQKPYSKETLIEEINKVLE